MLSTIGFPQNAPRPDRRPIQIRVLRPCLINGKPRPPGYETILPKDDALGAVGSGRAELVE